MTTKVLRGSTVGYPSDSLASCLYGIIVLYDFEPEHFSEGYAIDIRNFDVSTFWASFYHRPSEHSLKHRTGGQENHFMGTNKIRVCTVSSFFSFRPVSGKTKYDILDRFSHTACIKNKKAVL